MRGSWTSGRFAIIAVALCALAGCNSIPNSGIDPSGERIFAAPPPPVAADRSNELYFDQPLGELSWDDVAVELHPRETVAPVGSEVVLIAGICGRDGYLRTNRRLEWSIDPGGVGQFVDVGKTGFVDLMLGDFNMPRKITNMFAVGSTLRSNTRLNRGTSNPETNVYVLRGQGWISLTSAVEGTSNVTVFAPEVYHWNARLRSAMVHWVDAEWQFPPPAINPAGSRHVFTTAVTHLSNKTPCEGWRVRYEIVDGPPAGFSPDGAQAVEVPTDSAGNASIEIFQKEPRHGVNQIGIQVIRPGDLPGANGRRLVVGSGTTTKTWTGPDLAVKISGPQAGSPGATLTYRIDVSNPGDLSAQDVIVTEAVPDGLTYLSSNPPAESSGQQLQWQLGELGARQHHSIEVSFRADRQGSVANCCEVAAAGGLKARDCATTTITTASLDVRITGPAQAKVGEHVTFEITVTNLSQTAVSNLTIKDRLDSGLEHQATNQQNAIERLLGELAAGASQRIQVTVRVTKAGRLCQNVEISGPSVATATAQACVMAVGDGQTPTAPGVVPPGVGGQQPTQPPTPTLSVKISCPNKQLTVGERAQFTIEITNTGTAPLRNLKVVDRYDEALLPAFATDGFRVEGDGLVWMIDTLPAGRMTPLVVQCTCEAAAARACNRVSVTTSDGGKVEDEACLEIREAAPPPVTQPPEQTPTTPSGGLTLWVSGLHNPVAVGKKLTYEIRLRNEGSDSFRQLIVTATVPDGMVLAPIGTVGPDGAQPTIEGRTIRFDPVPEIRPDKLLVYRVRVLAKQPGREFRFHVEATAAGLPRPLVQEATTEVIER